MKIVFIIAGMTLLLGAATVEIEQYGEQPTMPIANVAMQLLQNHATCTNPSYVRAIIIGTNPSNPLLYDIGYRCPGKKGTRALLWPLQ